MQVGWQGDQVGGGGVTGAKCWTLVSLDLMLKSHLTLLLSWVTSPESAQPLWAAISSPVNGEQGRYILCSVFKGDPTGSPQCGKRWGADSRYVQPSPNRNIIFVPKNLTCF